MLTQTFRSAETPKQQEIRERGGRILEVARRHLLESGYLGLSMDRIAEEMRYSKGTIYQHFRNKEEILLALANEALEARAGLFGRAADLAPVQQAGASRQRIAAIGAAAEAFVENTPHYFVVEQIIRASSIWEKTSEERREYMRSCEQRCMKIVGGVVRDAVASGELALPDECEPADVVFGMWSMYSGAQTIAGSSDTLAEIGIASPTAATRRNLDHMLDGYGWRLASNEFDYSTHMDRVKQELIDHGA